MFAFEHHSSCNFYVGRLYYIVLLEHNVLCIHHPCLVRYTLINQRNSLIRLLCLFLLFCVCYIIKGREWSWLGSCQYCSDNKCIGMQITFKDKPVSDGARDMCLFLTYIPLKFRFRSLNTTWKCYFSTKYLQIKFLD